jgi:hypothetical protein
VGNKKIREEKYELLKLEHNKFKMKDDEGVEKMYSRMGVLIQSINALDVANLSEQEIIRKSSKRSPSQDTTSSRYFSLRRISLPSPSLRL